MKQNQVCLHTDVLKPFHAFVEVLEELRVEACVVPFVFVITLVSAFCMLALCQNLVRKQFRVFLYTLIRKDTEAHLVESALFHTLVCLFLSRLVGMYPCV